MKGQGASLCRCGVIDGNECKHATGRSLPQTSPRPSATKGAGVDWLQFLCVKFKRGETGGVFEFPAPRSQRVGRDSVQALDAKPRG
ncbi:hypothetical protein L1887_58240 [Cichorium endivia]|nr:hypothetical protein L1887_58240 [Cichorium endivia]